MQLVNNSLTYVWVDQWQYVLPLPTVQSHRVQLQVVDCVAYNHEVRWTYTAEGDNR